MTHVHASASSEGKLATGESQFMPLHLQMHPSMYSSPISILLEEMERERERQGQLSINAAAGLTHLVAG
jgi:hypothetical protein